MRSALVGSLLVSAALLAGCESSKEEQVDFVPMPKDMAVDIWHMKETGKQAPAAAPAPAPSSAPNQ